MCFSYKAKRDRRKSKRKKGGKRENAFSVLTDEKKRRRNSFESVAVQGKTVNFEEIFRRSKGRKTGRRKSRIRFKGCAPKKRLETGRLFLPSFRSCKTKNLCRADQSLSLRQAMPGSTLPSNSSREAPPPVEMCVILSAKPSCCTAAALSPPPMMVVALPYASARA